MEYTLGLYSHCNGTEIRLWVTPSWVTDICLSIDPTTGTPDGGMDGVRRRYLLWLDSQRRQPMPNPEGVAMLHRSIAEHKALIQALPNPHFTRI